MNLLPHNKELCDKIVKKMKNHHDICIVQGTGGGKSFILMYLVITQFKEKKIAIVTPKHDIKDGIKSYEEFKEVEHDVEFFTYNFFNSKEHIDYVSNNFDVVFVDEVHHIGSELYGAALLSLKEILISNDKYFFGLTATPIRSCDDVDVKSLFSCSVTGYSAFEFIQMGMMPQIEYLVCEREKLKIAKEKNMKEVIDYEYSIDLLEDIIKTNDDRNKWLCYFSSIAQLKSLRQMIKDLFPDYRYMEIYSNSENSSKEFSSIKKDEKVVIASVSKLLEGVHLDNMEGILLFRKVRSENVFEQILGRVLSINAKTKPLFIDCTSTGPLLLQRLLNRNSNKRKEKNKDSFLSGKLEPVTKDIITVSLKNAKYFDISKLLSQITPTSIIYKGTMYSSLNRLCNVVGINSEYLRKMRDKYPELSFDEAVDYCIENCRKTFLFRGVEYKTYTACYKEFGFESDPVFMRRRSNPDKYNDMTDQEVLEIAIRSNDETYVYDGVEYPSEHSCLIQLGLASNSISGYRRSHEEAKDIPSQDIIKILLNLRDKSFEFRGVTYESNTECFVAYGYAKSTNPVSRYRYMNPEECKGLSDQEVFEIILSEKEKRESDKAYIYKGITYKSERDCMISLGLGKSSVKSLRGKYVGVDEMTDEEFIDYVIEKRKSKIFQFRGVDYQTKKAACKEFGTTVSSLVAARKKLIIDNPDITDQEVLEYVIAHKRK